MDHLKDLDFEITDEGSASLYLGVEVKKLDNDTYSLTQPYLIQRIIDSLGNAVRDANTKPTPAVHRQILSKDLNGSERKQDWNY